MQLRYGVCYKWGASWQTTIKKMCQTVAEVLAIWQDLPVELTIKKTPQPVDTFLWECVRKTGSWYQAKGADGSALVDRDISLNLEKHWQSQVTPKINYFNQLFNLPMLPNSFDIYSVQERGWRSVPVMNPIALHLWHKAKQVPRSWLWECQRSFWETHVWEMFHKSILKAPQRQAQENRRKPQGCWSGKTTKKVFCDPEGEKETKCCQVLHVFFKCWKKIFVPFDLVSSIHAILKLQNSSL